MLLYRYIYNRSNAKSRIRELTLEFYNKAFYVNVYTYCYHRITCLLPRSPTLLSDVQNNIVKVSFHLRSNH